ncbi:hypothetical protein [Hymenobacter nivis]|uniref:Uncharacterized protein n=1 Tax=Hymenobacter nivis TaxID=1850093 RepID=A0A502GJQ2_9BACT|nr:hypothetical protein [Hymenobacter nivis]TPG61748.1 hypothetical protein EAH73_20060 [Hymenobacter nivis]
MRLIFYALLSCLGLANCEQHLYSKEERRPAAIPTAAVPVAAASERVWGPVAPAAPAVPGTAFTVNGRLHHVAVQARPDSAHPLTALAYFSEDDRARQRLTKVRGYDGRFTFTLRDAAGAPVFQRELRKADFAKMGAPDVVVESAVNKPVFLGYAPALQAMVFTVDFGAPESDVGFQVVLLLDLGGRVVRLSEGRALSGGPDTDPALAGNGRAVLTATEVLRPGQPPLRLARPGADLAGAFFLTDTTVLAVYDPGKNRPVRLPDGLVNYERRATPQQLQAPNAFVLRVRNGQVASSFRYHGYYEGMGYSVPHFRLPAAHTCYLLDEKHGLSLVPMAPGPPTTLKFAEMPRFVPPQVAQEVRFELQGEDAQFAFYADTLNPRHVRYQRLQD